MVKKLILSLSILILNLPSFSQTVTQTYTDTENILLPVRVAKQVAKDLVKGDSCFAQLKLSNVHIKELENKTFIQDTIITTLKLKEQNYIILVEQERKKTLIYQEELKLTQKEIKKLQAKRTFGRITYGVIIGGLTYLYITK
jgi:hypothetical protein